MVKNNRFFFPMTMAIITITSVVTILQFVHPEILGVLRRNPAALASGEWWRIITPLLVHADDWGQYIFNIVCIVAIGIEAERMYGQIRFLILYLAGGLIGEIAGYASWDPYGAGASVGLCGLLGGLIAVMISGKRSLHPIFAMVCLYIVVGFVGFASEKTYFTIGLFIVVAIIMAAIMRQNNRAKLMSIISGWGSLLGGMILLVFHDIHGVAIIGGVCTAFMILWTQGFRSMLHKS